MGRAALTDQRPTGKPRIVAFDDIPHSADAHRFAGAAHGDVPFSFIRVHSRPGVGPRLHRHPYHEVFVVEAGEATFTRRPSNPGSGRSRTSGQRPAPWRWTNPDGINDCAGGCRGLRPGTGRHTISTEREH